MGKKIISFCVVIVMVAASSVCAFATVEPTQNIEADSVITTSGESIVPYGTTSKRVLTNTSVGTKKNSAGVIKIDYNIKTYKIYQKPDKGNNWHYSYTEYVWSFRGYTYNIATKKWVYKTTKSGVDRVHGDPNSLISYYLKSME